MGRSFEAKCKQCRRLGEKLMLKGDRCNTQKCAMVKRNYPPGIHGQKGRQRQSDFGAQLAEKQKARKQYHLLEKQFRLTYDKASKQIGDAGENFMKLLEMRLDNVVYRFGFASSRNKARQMVNHGHFTVNGKMINIPSCKIKTGDVVEIKKNSKNNKLFKNIAEVISKVEVPGWLNMDIKEMKGKCLHEPSKKDFESNINTQMIVEYYSK